MVVVASTREIVDMSAGTVVKPAKQLWDSWCNLSDWRYDWKCGVRASGRGNNADRSGIQRVLVQVFTIEERLVQKWEQRDSLHCSSDGNTGVSANEVVQVRKCRANGCGDVSKRGALARATVVWKSEEKLKQEKQRSWRRQRE